ncbi:MAG: hypothetical protein ACFNXE_07085 [Rothia dentocariosa]
MTNNSSFPAAILFDHDGTLVDTEPVWAAAKVALAAEFGAPGPSRIPWIVWGFP